MGHCYQVSPCETPKLQSYVSKSYMKRTLSVTESAVRVGVTHGAHGMISLSCLSLEMASLDFRVDSMCCVHSMLFHDLGSHFHWQGRCCDFHFPSLTEVLTPSWTNIC